MGWGEAGEKFPGSYFRAHYHPMKTLKKKKKKLTSVRGKVKALGLADDFGIAEAILA